LIEVRIIEEPGYPGSFCSRLFRRGRFKVERFRVVVEGERHKILIKKRNEGLKT